MDVFNAVGSFIRVSETDVRALSGQELLLAYDNARDSGAQLEILGTSHEKIAGANEKLLHREMLRRLSMAKA